MPRTIKRYENRKLYDTEASAYVSLADVARLVRQGETVEVLDKATGQDLTAPTLTQIILEEGRQGRMTLSTDLLHDLLRRGGTAVEAGLEQLRHGVDDLMRQSLTRINDFVYPPRHRDLHRLRTQLNELETLLGRLLDERDGPHHSSNS